LLRHGLGRGDWVVRLHLYLNARPSRCRIFHLAKYVMPAQPNSTIRPLQG
jgi:hypothetical protein